MSKEWIEFECDQPEPGYYWILDPGLHTSLKEIDADNGMPIKAGTIAYSLVDDSPPEIPMTPKQWQRMTYCEWRQRFKSLIAGGATGKELQRYRQGLVAKVLRDAPMLDAAGGTPRLLRKMSKPRISAECDRCGAKPCVEDADLCNVCHEWVMT